MTNEMTEYYNNIKVLDEYFDKIKQNVPTSTCVPGDFYAILEDDYWHRVQCIDYESDTQLATVHFIDEGYEGQYKCDMLQPLEKKFCVLSSQVLMLIFLRSSNLRT